MKHQLSATLLIVVFFVFAQLIGLGVVSQYLNIQYESINGTQVKQIDYKELPGGVERPEIDESESYKVILLAILLGTLLALILIKFNAKRTWKVWFFISIMATLTVAFNAFIPNYPAIALGLILAWYKVFRPNFYIHNLTELFIYGGLAAIFVPIVNMYSAFILLAGISLYDMYAVWKSKHMIKLATFQSESKLFAGLSIPYTNKGIHTKTMPVLQSNESTQDSKKQPSSKKQTIQTAILGGGDIGFPLIFSGVVMKTFDVYHALFVTAFVTLSLYLLLHFSQKGKFYPAMPFLSAGCIIGYGVALLVL